MQAEMKANGFSGTILLARKGAPIVAKGYGAANAEWSIPNTPRTKFRWDRSPSSSPRWRSCSCSSRAS